MMPRDKTNQNYIASVNKHKIQLLVLKVHLTKNITETSPYKSCPRFAPKIYIVKRGKSGVDFYIIKVVISP